MAVSIMTKPPNLSPKGRRNERIFTSRLTKQVNNNSYHTWLKKHESKLKDRTSKDRYRASNVSFQVVKNRNQVIHFVQSNKSITLPLQPATAAAPKRKRRNADQLAIEEAKRFLARPTQRRHLE